MLLDRKEIPELFYMKHRNDTEYKTNENNLLDKSVSPHVYKNDTMNTFLKYLQNMVFVFFDQMHIIRNFKNPTVDKYEFRYPD